MHKSRFFEYDLSCMDETDVDKKTENVNHMCGTIIRTLKGRLDMMLCQNVMN